MAANSKTTRPASLNDGWLPTEPPDVKAARLAAWQDFRCCRDCRHWSHNDPDEDYDDSLMGACFAPDMRLPASCVITPEDYTCGYFEGLTP